MTDDRRRKRPRRDQPATPQPDEAGTDARAMIPADPELVVAIEERVAALPQWSKQSKRTPARALVILRALELGETRFAAYGAARIDQNTFYDWIKNDPAFHQLVVEAEALGESRLLGVIREAAPIDWRAAAWILEKKFPQRYTQRTKMDMTVSLQQMVEEAAREEGLDPAEVMAEVERITRNQRLLGPGEDQQP